MLEEQREPPFKPLKIWGVLQEAICFPWYFRRHVGFWILIATVVSVMCETVGNSISDWQEGDEISSKLLLYILFLWLSESIIFTVFAVLCHRLILLKEVSRHLLNSMRWTNREFRFLVLGTGMYIVVILCLIPFTVLMAPLFLGLLTISDSSVDSSFVENLVYFFMVAWGTGYVYLLGRYSLIFPAIAVDFFQPTLGWTWSKSIGNGWRLTVLVGAPLLIYFALINLEDLSLQYPLLLSFVENLMIFLIGSIEIAIISISFRELCEWDKRELIKK